MKTFLSLLLLLFFLSCSIKDQATSPSAQVSKHADFTRPKQNLVKSILMQEAIAEPEIIRPSSFVNCGLNEKSKELAKLIISSHGQQRPVIRCNSLLSKVASEQAKKLANAGVIDHFVGGPPNQRLVASGFDLVKDRRNMANTVEAILGGEKTADDAWTRFQMSFGHKRHLLGEHDMFREQTEIGVGHYYKWHSPHVDYWVVYLAKPNHQE
ncbi:CAP domain-containing protein [Kangiella sp. HZ709]|uniref:CAP domain-containing protein n=1 Tax=Kangiella sp. HZ709 TaxID=2666328 RepID=UPI0012AF8655|nr:CAP domain-containing protein [Kangiella sp. HZ709]MRX27007.1 CAP domain-containing protein [Kangiella sp. HZ709]